MVPIVAQQNIYRVCLCLRRLEKYLSFGSQILNLQDHFIALLIIIERPTQNRTTHIETLDSTF